ncbi:hypothetical protein E1B28_002495 [Marasmius oreades]|uniref:RING-type domain-containing protein n=1 Tax=Marasmius oreades TaxID=181124 RepID=A0A9P7RNR4_9AGAR|nr:uncharacterized protein E1B28_002495 [Marasmius oreades]KAG7086545.1 hypothetical protein E1B28_002495 [Marasmius oreades]
MSQTYTNNNKRQRSQLSRRALEFNPNEEFGISASPQNNQASTPRRHKSRSPSRTGPRPDPFDISPVAFTSSKLPRSSTSTLTRSIFASMDELSDPGQRVRSTSSSSLPPGSRHTNPRDFSVHVVPSTSQNKSHNKKDKGKERLFVRSSKQLPSEDSGSFSGPIAAAEFERMKKEIEELKNTVQDHKKTIKKQSKRIEELKTELNAGKIARKEHETQLQILSSKASKHEELVSALEVTFQCQICMDYLTKPFALSPCGHVLCVSCLQDWFRKAPLSVDDMDIDPEDAEDPEYLLSRQKTCPCCRAIITRRPAPVFLIKSAVEAIKKYKAFTDSSNAQRSESPLIGDEDPWAGFFPEEGVRNDDEDEEYFVRHYYLDDLYVDSDSDGLESIMMDADSASESGGEDEEIHQPDEEDGYQEEEEASDAESLEDPLFVKPPWEPPLDLYGREELVDLDEERSSMLQRGCTLWLIQTCHMEYTHNDGFVAYLYALNNERHSYEIIFARTAEERNKRELHRLFLGWNLHMPFNERLDEEGGKEFLTQTLELYKNQPWKFQLDERLRTPGKLDLHVLVRADGHDQGYETTDTEYYEW